MTWFALAVLASLMWAIVRVLNKTLAASEAPSTQHRWAITGVVAIAPVVLILVLVPRYAALPDTRLLLIVMLAGACSFISNAFFFQAALSIDVATTSASLAGIPGLTAIGSLLLLNEKIGWIPIVGIIEITAGVVLMSRAAAPKRPKRKLPRGAVLSLGAAVATLTAEYLIEGATARYLPTLNVFYWTRIGVLVCVGILSLLKPRLVRDAFRWAFLDNRNIGVLTISSECLAMLAVASLIGAYRVGPVGLATAIAYTQSAFVLVITLAVNSARPGTIPMEDEHPDAVRLRSLGFMLIVWGAAPNLPVFLRHGPRS
jgi:drug/metabolite transporter (DMT)-like permease